MCTTCTSLCRVVYMGFYVYFGPKKYLMKSVGTRLIKESQLCNLESGTEMDKSRTINLQQEWIGRI